MPAGFEVRPVPEDELPAMLALGYLAFHVRAADQERGLDERVLRGARRFGAYDRGRLVGAAATLDLELSVPGGALPCAGLTWVVVAPTHRRRGALTAMMRALLDDARERGQPLAALWAAEGAIYGRYGFGLATVAQGVQIDARTPLELRVEPDPRPLELIELADAPERLAAAHARERARRPGLPARTPDWWRDAILHTGPEHAELGLTEARVVVVGEGDDLAGYAVYRVRPEQDLADDPEPAYVDVSELVADTAEAAAALWRYLASIDLIAGVRAWNRPPDDPLPLLVADPDRVRLARRLGALWLRLLDVPAALAVRSWAGPVELTIGVRDGGRPENAGAWRLGEGECTRTDAPADLELDVRDLAAAYLGGVPLRALHAAGLVVERTQGAVAALDAALLTPLAPFIPDDF
jgi:predicted acetyltransferase